MSDTQKTDFLAMRLIVRIQHEGEGGIEKSVPRDHRLSSLGSQVMTNGECEGQIFLPGNDKR